MDSKIQTLIDKLGNIKEDDKITPELDAFYSSLTSEEKKTVGDKIEDMIETGKDPICKIIKKYKGNNKIFIDIKKLCAGMMAIDIGEKQEADIEMEKKERKNKYNFLIWLFIILPILIVTTVIVIWVIGIPFAYMRIKERYKNITKSHNILWAIRGSWITYIKLAY